jgi:hypothetical protein
VEPLLEKSECFVGLGQHFKPLKVVAESLVSQSAFHSLVPELEVYQLYSEWQLDVR